MNYESIRCNVQKILFQSLRLTLLLFFPFLDKGRGRAQLLASHPRRRPVKHKAEAKDLSGPTTSQPVQQSCYTGPSGLFLQEPCCKKYKRSCHKGNSFDVECFASGINFHFLLSDLVQLGRELYITDAG